jgi:GTP 3',8-cyclase
MNTKTLYEIRDGKIQSPVLEVTIVEHCNLSCRACSHLSPILPKYLADPAAIERDLKTLAEVYHARSVRLLGGEPLLHPHINRLLEILRASGVADTVGVETNGLLLGRMTEEFWMLIDQVLVTTYPGRELDADMVAHCRSLADKHVVDFRVTLSWIFRESYSALGTSDCALVQRIYNTCSIVHEWRCHTTADGFFYKCPLSYYIPKGLGADGDFPLTADGIDLSDAVDLKDRLLFYLQSEKPLLSCRRCLGAIGKEFPYEELPRRSWAQAQHHTVEELIDLTLLRKAAVLLTSSNAEEIIHLKELHEMEIGSSLKVTAIMATYNEVDIISYAIRELISQGIDVYLIDTGSTDATVTEARRFLGRGLLQIEELAMDEFWLARLMKRKEELAYELDSDWFINADADEFRESPWTGVSLLDGIRRVDALGYNAIDFAVFDFVPTHDDLPPGGDPREAFPFFEPGGYFNRLQIRCWKKPDGPVDLASSGGHEAAFPDRKVFPIRFLLRHYPFRGQAQAERKLFRERRPRYPEEEKKRGWHVQYNGISEGHHFVRAIEGLELFDPLRMRIGLTINNRALEEATQNYEAARKAAEELARSLAQTSEERDAARVEAEKLNRRLVHTLAERDATRARVCELQAALDEQDLAIAASEHKLENALAEMNKVKHEGESVETVLAAREHQLQEVYRSLSWRVTWPLRWLGSLVLKTIRRPSLELSPKRISKVTDNRSYSLPAKSGVDIDKEAIGKVIHRITGELKAKMPE